jgi:hypothetical protein
MHGRFLQKVMKQGAMEVLENVRKESWSTSALKKSPENQTPT